MAYTEEQLALRIKEKYPQYQGVDNSELVSRVLDKYPEYGAQLSEPEQRKNTMRDAGRQIASTLIAQGPVGPYAAQAQVFSPSTAEGQKLILAGLAQGVASTAAGLAQTAGEVEEIKTGVMKKAEERLLEADGKLPRAIGALFSIRNQMKEGASEKAFENASRIRDVSRGVDEFLDIDPEVANTFGGQVLRGFGNFGSFLGPGLVGKVVGLGRTALTGVNLANTFGQVTTESVMDAEDTIGKSYTQMTDDERNQVALASNGHGVIATALNFYGAKFSVPWMKGFLFDNKKVPVAELRKFSDQIKSVGKGAFQGFMGEGVTEALEGASVDSFARALYDDDRMLMSFDALKRRANEFLIGGIIGGTVRGTGTALEAASRGPLVQEQAAKTQPEEYVKEPEELGARKEFKITYLDQATGSTLTDTIEATSEAEARKVFEDGFASGSTVLNTGFEVLSVGPKDDVVEPTPKPIPGPGPTEQPRPLDLTAEARATYMPQRFVGERAEIAPPFFKRFQPEQYSEGRFVDIQTSEDLSDQTFEGGSIRIEDGRPALETSDIGAESIIPSKASEEGALVRTNLFKQKAGWKWTQAPEGEPNTIVSVEQGSKHYYTLDFTSNKPLTLKTYPDKKSEPRGRPTTRGKVQLGNKVGEIEIRGKKHPVYDTVTVGEPEITAEAAPFVAPQKAELSHVEQKDIIDMDALIEDIVENDIPVWFWYADQLGDGDLALPNKPGQKVTLDAGPSFALQPANRAAGRAWASSKSVKEINNKISQLQYTDKDGNKKTGYLFLVSGSPEKMFLFNKKAFTAFYKNAFGGTAFAKVKTALLATNPPKAIRESLEKHKSLKSLMDSADSRPFIEGLVNQRGKNTPLAKYLDSEGFFTLEPNQLRDGFYRDNDFRLNDILLVVRPTKGVAGNSNHGTYANAVMGEVVGVPDKKVDAFLLIPDEVRKEKEITMEPSLAAQVIAPYGARVTTIKSVVNSEQAQRAVKKLRSVIEGSPDGFTVDTSGELANGGFIVAPEKSTERAIDRDGFNEESLTKYIIDNAEILNLDGAMLGGWYDSESERYVLDVVFAVDNIQDAVDIAIWGDQNAIFDLNTFTEIRTKDDNKNPITPEGDTRAASEILKQKPAEALGEYSSKRRRVAGGVRPTVPQQASQPEVTAEAGTVLRPDEQPVEGGFNTRAEMDKYITEEFLPVAKKLGFDIVPNFAAPVARYNVTQQAIEYNPRELFKQSQDYIRSAMREEMIHAAMHRVLMKRSKSATPNQAWLNFFGKVGKDLTDGQRRAIEQVYRNLTNDVSYGAEYTRALIQQELYGRVTEQDLKFGPAFDKIRDLIKSVQVYISHALKGMSADMIEAAAVIKDSADLLRKVDPTARPANQSTVAAANKQVQEDAGILTAEAATELSKPPKKKKKKLGRELSFMDKYINTADTVLRRIHPEIANIFQRYVHSIDQKKFDAIKRTKPFIERYNKIKNKKDQQRLKQLLMYSPLEEGQEGDPELLAERDALLRKYDLYNLYKTNIVPVLFRIRSEAQIQGIDVGFLEGYFPRRVIDYEALRESFGRPIARDFRSYVDEINRQRRRRNLEQGKNEPLVEINSEEEALIFEKYIRNGEYVNRGVKTKKPRGANQRTIELIPTRNLEFYDNPGSALEYYISSMIHATETKRVFGERYVTEGEDVRLSGEIGPLLQNLIERGQIDEEAAFRTLPHFARMILNSANRENVFLGNMRQFSYLTTMVEFTSTLSQLYDLPFVLQRAGLLNTVNAMRSPKHLKLEDYGIDNDRISDEFRDEKNLLTQSVKLGLKASGFTRLDQFLKETSLNAAYSKLAQDAKHYYKDRKSNRSRRFRATVEAAVGVEQADATIAALKKGDRNNALVRDLIIRESLEKTQPITKMQMPVSVSANPNARLVYQMKSFMVVQLNYARNEILNEVFSGDKKRATQGMIRLIRLLGFMLLVGVPVDAMKDFLAGRIAYMSDYVFNGIFRLAGVSKYQVYQTKKEGIGSALIGYVAPITAQQFVDNTLELQRVMSGDKALTDSKLVTNAPFSDVLNRIFGFGKEKQRKKYIRRRLEKGELPTFIPPGSM